MVFDTDVLIWTLRGNVKAASVIERDGNRAVSIVSCMELLQGARDRRDMAIIRQFLLDFETIPLSEEVGYRAYLYMEQLALMLDLAPGDALIAATAVERQQALCTGNAKHYRRMSELEVKTFRP